MHSRNIILQLSVGIRLVPSAYCTVCYFSEQKLVLFGLDNSVHVCVVLLPISLFVLVSELLADGEPLLLSSLLNGLVKSTQ